MWIRLNKFGENEWEWVIDLSNPEYFNTCSRCGKVCVFDYEGQFARETNLSPIFENRRNGLVWHDVFDGNFFCFTCVSELLPWAKRFRDLDELILNVNNLERKIHEIRRRENNRATA